jgi:hypothetical protein
MSPYETKNERRSAVASAIADTEAIRRDAVRVEAIRRLIGAERAAYDSFCTAYYAAANYTDPDDDDTTILDYFDEQARVAHRARIARDLAHIAWLQARVALYNKLG